MWTRPFAYTAPLRELCLRYGFGAIMQESVVLWREYIKEQGQPKGGNFVTGPCEAMVVPCGCDTAHKCAWCCGCGWLTEHVKSIKDGGANVSA